MSCAAGPILVNSGGPPKYPAISASLRAFARSTSAPREGPGPRGKPEPLSGVFSCLAFIPDQRPIRANPRHPGHMLFITISRADEPGFLPLFNGNDLTGWRQGNNDHGGREDDTEDGRFAVQGGILVISGSKETPPEDDRDRHREILRW